MFKQDILIGTGPNGEWAFHIVTDKGRDFVKRRLRKLWDIKVKKTEGGVEVAYLDPKQGLLAYKAASKIEDFDIYYWMEAPLEVVSINARAMFDEYQRKKTGSAISDYFGPLIEDAINRRDKKEISKLIEQFPAGVEKACTVDRIIYGANGFPELKKSSETGVNLSNWHLHG